MADGHVVVEQWWKVSAKIRMLVLILAVLLLDYTEAVDRSNFKTCEQSSFCRRNRALQAGDSHFAILADTVKFEPSSVKAHILNSRDNVTLTLTIDTLEKQIARLRINELNPLRPRYECKDSLVKEPAKISYTKVKDDSSGCKVSYGSNSLAVTYKPFRVDFFQDDILLMSLNSRGLMNFEHYRNRHSSEPEAGPPADDTAEGEQPEKSEEEKQKEEEAKKAEEEKKELERKEQEGLWEETFNSHHDSKPRGPSSIGLDFSFIGFEHVYGIPEHADSFALKTTHNTDPYRLYSLDVFKYELNNPMALYGSIPFMVAHSKQKTVGMFWNNAAETWIDIKSSSSVLGSLMSFFKASDSVPEMDTHWFSESGIIDTFVMLGPKPHDVFQQYASLTGTTPLPPLFGIAYHQSRWNYNDEDDVKAVDENFDKHDIPYDVIWLDIEHTDGKKYFTWDTSKFGNPKQMQDNLATKGRKMVTIIDPHIKREDGYHIHQEAGSKNYYVRNKDGGQYEGWCWPGSSSWIDFTNPDYREWWASKFALDQYQGSTLNLFTWNDMNEPSVFNGPEITMHKDALHHQDWEHRDVHNIFGMYVHQATMQGQIQRSGGTERPFVLSRAFFAGSQRFGAIWTGDNTAAWDHLKISVPMLLSIGVAGLPFSGADVGGFFDNPDAELLARWYQAAAYQPFFRAHAHLDTKRREPWLYDENTKNVIRHAIGQRYIFLPFWYTVFREAYETGAPVMRPLWAEYPEDTKTFDMEDEYLIGTDLLVKPVTAAGQTSIDVYFPGGENEIWYDNVDFTAYKGGQIAHINAPLSEIPVFQRGGSIIPRKERIRRSSSLGHRDPYTLVIALNSTNQAYGELYIDDGHSFDYKNGKYIHAKFQFTGSHFIKWNAHADFETKAWVERIIFLGVAKPFPSATLMGKDNMRTLEAGYIAGKHVYVVKKPGVNIAEDFSIVFT